MAEEQAVHMYEFGKGAQVGPRSGGRTGFNPGEKSAPTPGGKTATTAGEKSGPTAGEKSGPTPGGKTAPTPGEKAGPTSGEKSAPEPGGKSVPEPGEKSASSKGKKSASSKADDGKTKLIGYDDENFATKEEKAEDLKRRFQPNNAKVVRKEMFANLYDPAVTIRNGNITFNTACIKGLEDVVYVHMLIDVQQGIFAVRGCKENDKDAIRWCTSKNDKRKPRRMTCSGFTDYLYKVMGWDTSCRYKVLG